jgi:hypothetical protein
MEYTKSPADGEARAASVERDAARVPSPAYGSTRNRRASVSYEQIDRAARELMAAGRRPSVQTIRKTLGGGSPQYLARGLRKFWERHAALNTADPVALASLPPEIAEAARAQWQMALDLAQQAARSDDSAARTQLAQLQRENELRARSIDLRELEREQAARERERALAEARAQVNELLTALECERAELDRREARIATLESQVDQYRRQITHVIASAIAKNQELSTTKARHEAHSTGSSRASTKAIRRAGRAKGGAKP